MNQTNFTQVDHNGYSGIKLKEIHQQTNISYSVFTKQKFPINNGLEFRASLYINLETQQYSDGIALILQNHKDGNKYIGEHGYQLGLKNNSDCALIFKFQSQQYTTVSFANKDFALIKLKNSLYLGLSTSQYTSECSHEIILDWLNIRQKDCQCPFSGLVIQYKEDYNSFKQYEKSSVLIEKPKICSWCDGLQLKDSNVYLIVDYIWKVTGKELNSTNSQKYIEFELPYLVENVDHVMAILIGDNSFAEKKFKIEPNEFLSSNWKSQFVLPDSNIDESQPLSLPLTGFDIDQPTQPPDLPPLDDQTTKLLKQNKQNFIYVDVYSRPIYKSKEENELVEYSDQRIKIDNLIVNTKDYGQPVKVKSWVPSQQIQIQNDKYVLHGQIYEYEVKRNDGSLIKRILTRPEPVLKLIYDGICYGNYCGAFFCKNKNNNQPPISELDQICKQMNEDPNNAVATYISAGAEFLNNPICKKLDRVLKISDIVNIIKILKVKCPDIKCEVAQFYLIKKMLVNQLTILGKIDLLVELLSELTKTNQNLLSNQGKWVKGKFTGDPHIKNLDGCLFDFQGQGEYILLQDKMIGFAIHSRFQKNPLFNDATTINAIAIRGFWGAPIVYFESLPNEFGPVIRINGLIVKMDRIYEIPNLKIEYNFEYFIIQYSNNVEIYIKNHGYGFFWTVIPQVYTPYSTKLEGILGNGDSVDDEKDFLQGGNTQEGYQTIKSCQNKSEDSIWKFGQSWRLTKKSDSILFYKNNQNPDTFYDENWKPKPTSELMIQFSPLLNTAKEQCSKVNQEELQFCIQDYLLFQNVTNKVSQESLIKIYQSSKQVPEKKNVILTFKSINETSVELNFFMSSSLYDECQNNCQLKVVYQQDNSNAFQTKLDTYEKLQQKTSKVLTGLNKYSFYTFQAMIKDTQSNQVNFYAHTPKCLPLCAKSNACGDDGCGGQCDIQVKCQTQCLFGVCKIENNSNNNNNTNNNNNGNNNNNNNSNNNNGNNNNNNNSNNNNSTSSNRNSTGTDIKETTDIQSGSDSNSKELSTLAIVLITVFVSIAVIISGVIFIRCYRRKKFIIKPQIENQDIYKVKFDDSIQV
ncbi:hypothetical protein ABPG74_003743 [Tetrahymena malaccensis]